MTEPRDASVTGARSKLTTARLTQGLHVVGECGSFKGGASGQFALQVQSGVLWKVAPKTPRVQQRLVDNACEVGVLAHDRQNSLKKPVKLIEHIKRSGLVHEHEDQQHDSREHSLCHLAQLFELFG